MVIDALMHHLDLPSVMKAITLMLLEMLPDPSGQLLKELHCSEEVMLPSWEKLASTKWFVLWYKGPVASLKLR